MASISAPRTYTSGNKSTNAAQTHPYTCNSCQVAFRNSDLQRTHMRTDWHRYNLKRRVASLPPISAETFNDKVLTAQASSNAVAAKASYEKACAACQKLYYSQNSYDNHLNGHRHRTAVAILAREGSITDNGSVISSSISLGEPINRNYDSRNLSPNGTPLPQDPVADVEGDAEFSEVVNALKEAKIAPAVITRHPSRPHHSNDDHRIQNPLSPEQSSAAQELSDDDQEIPITEQSPNQCLFCLVRSPDFESNAAHMGKTHGLFIPEKIYLVDPQGLFQWLWQRVNEEPHQCLYCHKLRSSADAVRGHMRDSGHCKIAFEEEEDMIEVGQFYDFSSTYSDDDGDDAATIELEMTAVQDQDAAWEDESGADSDEFDEGVMIDRSKQAIISSSRTRIDPSTQGFVVDEELYLPSGRIAGHRSLKKYFRQNLHNRPSPSERLEQQKRLGDGNTATVNTDSESTRNRGRQLVSRANGGLGMIGVDDAKKREVAILEKKDAQRAQRAENRYKARIETIGNSQKHFRDPLLQ